MDISSVWLPGVRTAAPLCFLSSPTSTYRYRIVPSRSGSLSCQRPKGAGHGSAREGGGKGGGVRKKTSPNSRESKKISLFSQRDKEGGERAWGCRKMQGAESSELLCVLLPGLPGLDLGPRSGLRDHREILSRKGGLVMGERTV